MEAKHSNLALGFAYVENLINSSERDFAVGSSLSILESTKETLDKAGIQKMVYEDFYEDFEALVQNITKPDKGGRTLNTEQLLSAFQKPECDLLGIFSHYVHVPLTFLFAVSNSIVIYLRFLTVRYQEPSPLSYLYLISVAVRANSSQPRFVRGISRTS